MRKLTNPTQFKEALLKTSKVSFEDESLKIEANRINEKNSKRAIQLRYFHLINGIWQSFAIFVSPNVKDCLEDVSGEFRLYGIS